MNGIKNVIHKQRKPCDEEIKKKRRYIYIEERKNRGFDNNFLD